MESFLKLSTYAIISYIISWLYFLITLPLFIAFFGKVKGSAINYGISWILMIVVVYILQRFGEKLKLKNQPLL